VKGPTQPLTNKRASFGAGVAATPPVAPITLSGGGRGNGQAEQLRLTGFNGCCWLPVADHQRGAGPRTAILPGERLRPAHSLKVASQMSNCLQAVPHYDENNFEKDG
jgi:hypothetical protein